MYWIFLALFIFAVLAPDIVRTPLYFLTEERLEEILIFFMGAVAFFVFIKNERKINLQKKEKQQADKKIDQTVRDLVESYSYIGEVNRKMDMLMGIALGLSDSANLSKKKEAEIYESIIVAANFLMKAEDSSLRFIDTITGQTKKELHLNKESKKSVQNKDLIAMGKKSTKKVGDMIFVSSAQAVNSTKCYLIVYGYDPVEERSPKNTEILKVFVSQALFLYSFVEKSHLLPAENTQEAQESLEKETRKDRFVKYLKKASRIGS